MNRSVLRVAAVVAVFALLGLCPPAPVFAEGEPAVLGDDPRATHVMVLSSDPLAAPAPAPAPTVSREQALELLKRYFPVSEGPGTLQARLENREFNPVWDIMYQIDRADGSSYGYGIAQVDARTGKLYYFNLNRGDWAPIRTGPLGKAYPESYARTWAWLLVKDLYPAEAAILRPAPPESSGFAEGPLGNMTDDYVFRWESYHGDVPVDGQGVTVTMDKYTLDYTGFYASFPTLTFPSDTPTVTPEQALKLYRERLKPTLAYMPVYGQSLYPYSNDRPAMKLVYRMDQDGLLDAVSGRFVSSAGEDRSTVPQPEAVPQASGQSVRLPALPLTSDTATAYVKALFGVAQDVNVSLEDSPFQDGPQEFYLNWMAEQTNVSVTIEAETGMVRSAYKDRQNGSQFGEDQWALPAPPDAARQAKAKEAAVAAVQHYYGDLVSELKLQPRANLPEIDLSPRLDFFFQRYVNGIPAGDDGVRVSIDPESMSWGDISLNWSSNATFQKAEALLSPVQAADHFFAANQPRLVYHAPLAGFYFGPGGFSDPEDSKATLVYRLGTGPAIFGPEIVDANTGEVLNWGDWPPADSGALLKVPAGHWAEGELQYMVARRAIDPDRLNPDASLNRAEALRLLMVGQSSSGYYPFNRSAVVPYKDVKQTDPLYGLVTAAVSRGILKPEGAEPVFGGAQPVTRMEFAVWLARTLNLDELAGSGLVTASTFTDIADLPPAARNAIAFLQALGVAGGGDEFRPAAHLTQAEAAAMTVPVVERLRQMR